MLKPYEYSIQQNRVKDQLCSVLPGAVLHHHVENSLAVDTTIQPIEDPLGDPTLSLGNAGERPRAGVTRGPREVFLALNSHSCLNASFSTRIGYLAENDVGPGNSADSLHIKHLPGNVGKGMGYRQLSPLLSRESHDEPQGYAPVFPSLVVLGVTQHKKIERCKNSVWIQGKCEHGSTRWYQVPCKKRGCPVCGQIRRKRIARRIAHGIIEKGDNAAWFVGTFNRDIKKNSANKIVAKFVRWLRKYTGKRIEYASTWELHESGRLHVNLVLSPWTYINQRYLSKRWERFGGGRVVWIKRVTSKIGLEMAKVTPVWKCANYFAKFEQMVLEGRGACYSKGWPKLKDSGQVERIGKISWTLAKFPFRKEIPPRMFWEEKQLPGEWGQIHEYCNCFHLKKNKENQTVLNHWYDPPPD